MLCIAIAPVLVLVAAAHAPDTDALLDAAVSHRQGWGELGVDVRAFDPARGSAPIRIGGREYAQGLGTHAPQETVFDLGGRYLGFEAEVGVQEQEACAGSVVFRAIVDGKTVFETGLMTAQSPAQAVRIDLRGAQELILIATDAGDGIMCDTVNWANARLAADPGAAGAAPQAAIDLAPFARVVGFDPARSEGTKTTRLDEWPEEDLYLESTFAPDAGGCYEAPAHGGAAACIGLQWLERRRIAQLALIFDAGNAAPAGDAVRLEWWDGMSRWQGAWRAVEAVPRAEGRRLVWALPRSRGDLGALQFRWVLPASAAPWRIAGFEALSRASTAVAEIEIAMTPEAAAAGYEVSLYNAGLAGGDAAAPMRVEPGKPLRAALRYTRPKPWQASDRSLVRLEGDTAHTFAIDTLLERGRLDLRSAGVFVTSPPGGAALEQHRRETAGAETVLDRVRRMPDQTLDKALAALSRRDAGLGPTLLSLACDNRKFLLERSGVLRWSDDPAVYDVFDKSVDPAFTCAIEPRFGGADAAPASRTLDEGWRPIVSIATGHDGVRYTQRTFVAPAGDGSGGPAAFVEFDAAAMDGSARPFRIDLRAVADSRSGAMAAVSVDGTDAAIGGSRGTLAMGRAVAGAGIAVQAADGQLSITGQTPARYVVAVPRAAGGAPDLEGAYERAVGHWDAAMAGGARIGLPDERLERIVRASLAHCLMAARNDAGRTVAPWIGAIHYGPLESEGHSVVRGMMSMGFEDFARRALQYYVERYNDAGFLTTGYTTMGTGWHLWTLGEWHSLYRDDAWLRGVAPEVARVCGWVGAQRAKTQHRPGEREAGLMPPGPLADWNLYAYYFYGNGYYAAGLEAAGAALAAVGHPGAEAIRAEAAGFKQTIARALAAASAQAPAVPLQDGAAVPFYPCQVYAPGAIGDLYPGDDGNRSWCYDVELGAQHLAAMGVIDPRGPETSAMLDYQEDHQFLREGWFDYDEAGNHADWFGRGGFAKVQPYYARTGELHALRDDPKPFLRTYFNSIASLLNPEDLSFWEHFFNGAFNKTHETGYFLYQTSQMLAQVREGALWLAPLIPSAWIEGDAPILVEGLPTSLGRTGFALRPGMGGHSVAVEIAPPDRVPSAPIVLRLRRGDGRAIAAAVQTAGPDAPPAIDGNLLRLRPASHERIALTVQF